MVLRPQCSRTESYLRATPEYRSDTRMSGEEDSLCERSQIRT